MQIAHLLKWKTKKDSLTHLYCVGLYGCPRPSNDETCQETRLLLASLFIANVWLHVSSWQASSNPVSGLVTWNLTRQISLPVENSGPPHPRPRWCILSTSSFPSLSPFRTCSSVPCWCWQLAVMLTVSLMLKASTCSQLALLSGLAPSGAGEFVRYGASMYKKMLAGQCHFL